MEATNLYKLSDKWLNDNFVVGTLENTKVGDTVYIRDMDGFDEVLVPHTVLEIKEDGIISKENSPCYSIPLFSRGQMQNETWYLKKQV